MPALLTADDRAIHRIQAEVAKLRRWIIADQHDRRAVAFFQAKIVDLESELDRLLEGAA